MRDWQWQNHVTWYCRYHFRSVMAALRNVVQNPEWHYVQEGPKWWGRRVANAAAIWEAH